MYRLKTPPRNPRYLQIPTLLASLLCAHVIHMACEPLGVNVFFCTVLYLFGLALPIVVKRAFTPRSFDDFEDIDDTDITRLPTSRFSTTHNTRRV